MQVLTSAALLSGLTLAAFAAFAQSPTSFGAVEVTGKAVRHDVVRTCPDIQATLNEELASAYSRVGREGEFKVSFTLHQNQVSQVQAAPGAYEYRSAVRRAMREVSCQDSQAAASPQQFAFILAIREGSEGASASVRALD